MIFEETYINGNYIINIEKNEDERGFFSRIFCEKEFRKYGLNTHWIQVNNSMSVESGTLRGLHFQRTPRTEVKLVRCIRGSIWDVVVDLRENSETFGKWFGTTLSEENRTMMYVPKGFAHGFITLKHNSEILYHVSEFYTPEIECTLIWNDRDIGIKWPIMPKVISEKDLAGLNLADLAPINISI